MIVTCTQLQNGPPRVFLVVGLRPTECPIRAAITKTINTTIFNYATLLVSVNSNSVKLQYDQYINHLFPIVQKCKQIFAGLGKPC